MRLYHFTDKIIKDKVKVKYFADNIYTQKDKQASTLQRAFFFADDIAPEYRFKACKYRYTVNIDSKRIYNLAKDSACLISKSKNIDKLLKELKRLDYIGASYNIGYDIIIAFYDVTVSKKELISC